MDRPATCNSTRATGLRAAIGGTPLLRLDRASESTGCEVLAKAEFANPGGSVKDRAALAILVDAEQRGQIEPGGIVVEGTAGNTGIGLAMLGNAAGYRTVIVMSATQSREKQQVLRALGAEVYVVPEQHHQHPDNYRHIARRMAAALRDECDHGVLWADQFDNLANRHGHWATTGPEIWDQAGGEVDAFVCSVGTGGCLAGVSQYLREQRPDVVIGLADSEGAALYEYYTTGVMPDRSGSIVEGIGLRWMTRNLEDVVVDVPLHVSDRLAVETLADLARHEGLLVGGSSGVNVAGAIRLARDLGPGHTVVTILGDSLLRYGSTLLEPAFLAAHGLASIAATEPSDWARAHPVEQYVTGDDAAAATTGEPAP